MDRRQMITGLWASSCLMAAAPVAYAGPKAEGGSSTGGQLRMALINATVLRRTGRRGVMSVESTLDIADGALFERAKLSQPRLNAAFNEAIQLYASRMLPHAVPDLDGITATLQRATDRVLGRAGAKVLLGTVMVT